MAPCARAAIAAIALLLGAGCGARSGLPDGVCGDGHHDEGEACDAGKDNAKRGAILLTQGTVSRWVTPIDRAGDVVAFYAYGSKSGHTGFEALERSELYLYRDLGTSVLSLVSEHGIDLDATMQSQPQSRVEQRFTGLPPGTSVAFADDDATEFAMDSPTTAAGTWNFLQNTDGGGLSGLPLPGRWSIDVTFTFLDGIDGWRFIDGDGAPIALDPGATATLTTFDEPSPCNPDCSLPACGDGFLDAGEVCDDGNTIGGDGCAADCQSLR